MPKGMYDEIFKPVKIGKLTAENRVIFPPISTNFAKGDGHLSELFTRHYVRRARGDAGIIVVENSCVSYPEGKHGAYEPRIDSWEFYDDWHTFAKEFKNYASLLSVELTHEGWKKRGIGFLSDEKIWKIIESYGTAAEIACKAGFDMVEMQGAHGLLVNQFLSPLTNNREDKWQESERFAIEIRKEIAKRCGWNFPVTIRLAVDDFKEGGINLDEGKRLASVLSEYYDMIQADIGLGPKELRLEPMPYQQGWRSYLAERIRPLPVPVAAVGMLRDPSVVSKVLRDKADMVVLGRTLIADPDWLIKVRNGRVNEIRKCIGCSECIKARHDEDTAIRCGANPQVGREIDIKTAKQKKLVLIIGGGPAGLEAARVAALRGHDVHIFYDEFGGALNLAAVPPGKDKIRWMIEYYDAVLPTYENITMHNRRATKEDVLELNPDAVIMATGSRPFLPCPPVRNFVYMYDEVLRGEVKFEGMRLVVGGGGLVGCETANMLADRNEVTIVEMLPDVAIGMETLSRRHLLAELKEKGVKIIKGAKITSIARGYVVARGDKEYVLESDAMIAAFGSKPFIPFTLDEIPVSVIGDAKSVRNIYAAVNEGFNAVMSL